MLESEVREVTSSRRKCGGVSSHSLASWEGGQVRGRGKEEKQEAETERGSGGSKEGRKERKREKKGKEAGKGEGEGRERGKKKGERRERGGREERRRAERVENLTSLYCSTAQSNYTIHLPNVAPIIMMSS